MKKLTRSRDDAWFGGVCGGVADYTGLDAGLVRVLVVVATVLGFGSLVIAYIVAWILIPKAPQAPRADWTATPPPTGPAPAPPSQ